MTISYIEKGRWLHKAVETAGYNLICKDGVWESDNDSVVQGIIDSFDPLPEAKKEAANKVKKVAASKIASLYPFIDPDGAEAIGLYNFAEDLYLSISEAARNPLSGRLLELKNIYDAAVAAISDINTATDWKELERYDAINTPIWP